MLRIPNAYRFTNKTHTDECYADISHYLQKNLRFSRYYTPQIALRRIWDVAIFCAPRF